MRLIMGTLVVALSFSLAAASQSGASDGQWRYYGGDAGHSKYSPLAQINAQNVGQLEVAWEWDSPDAAIMGVAKQQPGAFKVTPIMVDGVLYVSTQFNQVAALDAKTGKTKWVYDPEVYKLGRPTNAGWQHRGVSYWADGDDERIVILTGLLKLIALDAKTGKPVSSFGENGIVDTLDALGDNVSRRLLGNSAPVAIIRDTIVCGSTIFDRPTGPEMPPGHVRAYDVRTGALKWVFNTIPRIGEFGNETWENGSWRYSGNTNVWTMISGDEELGYVYLPISTPTNDYYGGHRKGNNLFAESLVCLNAETGERVWHFQAVHHGLWDYDFPAAPTICDITVDGKKIKAVAVVSKQGFTYVFDRATGEPVWPIEERPVPQTTVPGEQTSPTQPFPTKPPPFVRQGFSEDDVIDFTPELRAAALEKLKDYEMGPLFTPPSLFDARAGKRGVIQMPSAAGGANWGGAAFDPDTGMLYLQAASQPSLAHVSAGNKDRGVRADYLVIAPIATMGPEGLPFWKPPYAVVVGIDLNAGDIAWKVAHGDGPRDHPAIKHLNLPKLGASSHGFLSSGGPLLTKTLLFINQVPIGNNFVDPDPDALFMRAFDKRDGSVVWEHKVDTPPFGTPMTYMVDGRQYIVVAFGGKRDPSKLVAYALPE